MQHKLPKKLIYFLLPTLPILLWAKFCTPAYAVTETTAGNNFIQGVQIPSDKELYELIPTHLRFDGVKFQYALGSDQPLEQWLGAARQGGYKILLSVTKNETNPKIPTLGNPSETGQWCPWDNELKPVPRQGSRPIYDPKTRAIVSWENYTYYVREASPIGNGYMEFRDQMKTLTAKLAKDNLIPDAIEIWNEPNLAFEWTDQGLGPVSPQNYARFLECGIKGAKAGLPSSDHPLFISAGLAPLAPDANGNMNDFEFFDKFLAAAKSSDGLTTSAYDSIDAFGWHSDVVKNIPPESADLDGFQRVTHALNHGKPVWLTEFGWARNQAGIYISTQRQYINEAFQVGPTLGDIEAMFVWNFGYGALNPDFKEWDIQNTQELPCELGGQTNVSAGFDSPDYIAAPSLQDDDRIVKTADTATLPTEVVNSANTQAQQNLLAHKYQGTIGVKADVLQQFPGIIELLKNLFCHVKIFGNLRVCTVGVSIGQQMEQQGSTPGSTGQNTEYFDQRAKILGQSYLPADIALMPQTNDCRITTAKHADGPDPVGNTEINDLSETVGTNTGFYGVSLPNLADTDKTISSRQKSSGDNLGLGDHLFNYDKRVPDIDTRQDLFYQANFPEGITPFKQSP